ncbi:DEAD/DEAH box helicase [Kocuria sp. CPCC 205268]|uniref:DEAD/DEAH box helicase n=1 Tax=Kocuria oxytropis TaxID=3058913 RepID=UPI0034D7B8A3
MAPTRSAIDEPRRWSDLPHAEAVRAAVGTETFARGAAYARSGRVHFLTSDPGRRILFAAVDGTARQPYQTLVQVGDARGARPSSGRCTCPMAVNCKHVAAVLVAALEDLGTAAPATPAWEQRLADVVEEADPEKATGTPIGLQFEVEAEPGGRGRPETLRVRLRPVVPGKKSAWIRTGISWRDLAYPYGARGQSAGHREALRALYQAHQSTAYYYGEPAVLLDEFGPALWPLLRGAVEAGVPLVPAKRAIGPVVLADAPASLSLDLTADGQAMTAAPAVHVPGVDEDGASASLVGDPAHGVVLARAGTGLVLAPLQRPLTRQASALLAAGPLQVPGEDVARFLAEYYPALVRIVPVRSPDGSVELPEIAPPRLGLTLSYDGPQELALSWSFRYDVDGAVRSVPLDAAGGPGRDRAAEQALLRGLTLPGGLGAALGAEPGSPVPAPTARLRGVDAAVFTEEGVPALREQGVVVDVVGDPVEYRRSEAAPVIRVSASDSEEADWFDLGVTVEIDGEHIPFEPLFVALARQDSHLVLDSGTWFSIDRPELDRLRRLIEEARLLTDREPGRLRVTTYQAGLWEELASLGVVEEQSERWSAAVGRLLAGEDADPPAPPAGLAATLRPYQLEGYRWLAYLWDAGLGGILADDMGLGKTVQTLAAVLRARENGTLPAPVLVVAPTSVVGNWAEEAARFAPGLAVSAVERTERKAGRALAETVAGADVVVTSYALFRIDEQAYQGLTWSGLVLDEAQFVKNHQAKTYQCARRLPAPFKLAITGTPLENSLMDLWSLLSIAAPGVYPDPKDFTETYRKPIEHGEAPELLGTLRRRIRPFIRRRTKEQVTADLPPKQEQVLGVALNPRHAKVYQTHLQRERRKVLSLLDDVDRNRFTILKSLTLLRQLALDPALVDEQYAAVRSSKTDVLLEQLQDVVGGGHRALVFSQFTGFLKAVRDRLDAEGITHVYLDGRTRNRSRRIEEFKAGTAPVFLISLKAGGFGLNLTEADYCFILDPWWNPAAEAQAVDRTHRIGQDKTVMVYRLVADETIEEKVVELQDRKRDLFDKVVDEGGELSAPLSAADIKELLAP